MLTDARKRANKKWEDKNKDRINYLRCRSTARSFIKKRATKEDLKELELLIKERREAVD